MQLIGSSIDPDKVVDNIGGELDRCCGARLCRGNGRWSGRQSGDAIACQHTQEHSEAHCPYVG